MASWHNQKLKNLAQAILTLKTERELLNFLRDLCTLEELTEMSTRWEIAQQLSTGQSYRTIAKEMGVSTTTVARIAHWLEHGENGYKNALKKIRKK